MNKPDEILALVKKVERSTAQRDMLQLAFLQNGDYLVYHYDQERTFAVLERLGLGEKRPSSLSRLTPTGIAVRDILRARAKAAQDGN